MLRYWLLLVAAFVTTCAAHIDTILWDVDEVLVTHAFPSGRHVRTINDGILAFIDHLRSNKITCIVYSAMTKQTHDYLFTRGFFKHFDSVELVLTNGLSKEKSDSYKVLIKKYSLNPDTTLFVDDRPINLAAAKEAGIKHSYEFSLKALAAAGEKNPALVCVKNINPKLPLKARLKVA